MTIRSILFGTLTLFAVIGATLGQVPPAANDAPAKPEPGKPVADLQITVDSAAHGAVDVTLQNVGKTPMVLNLGIMLNNGRTMIPSQVHLLVTGAAGRSRTLMFPQPAGVAGRMDDFLVPLMPAAKYTMTFPLNGFAGNTKLAANDKIQAVYEGAAVSPAAEAAIPNMPVWKGKVESVAVPYAQ